MILIFTKGEGDGIVSWLTFKIFSTLPSKTTSVDLKQSYKKSCSNLFWRRVIIFKHYSFLSLKKILFLQVTCEREKKNVRSAKELNYCSMFTDRESSIKSTLAKTELLYPKNAGA